MALMINYRALDISNDAEVAAIAEIHEQAPSYWITGHRPTREQIQSRIEQLQSRDGYIDRFCQLAETADGILVGFHWLDLKEARGKKYGYIISLWVHDDFQHKGIAMQLKRNGESWAKQMGASYLKTTVHAKNPRMVAFNMRRGFEQGFIEMTKKL